ncbi:MAG TPA: copper amine oxidase N-terminal domain-containing protein [Syntrophomonadaceae bacterium]|nr:copper amine oxidase N-terminal domain-containing protein [Syntrophomonadaceae bacterium]
MKKISIILFLILTVFIIPLPARADDTPRVFLDGQELTFDVLPIVVDGRILVPMRGIFEPLGLDCHWEEPNHVFCGVNGEKFWMEVGSYIAWAGQKEIDLDVPAQVINGRVMIPLRAVAEACMCKVNYDADTNAVNISSGHRLKQFSLYRGWDPDTGVLFDQMEANTKNKIAIQSERVTAQVIFSDKMDDEIIWDWQFLHDDHNKELVLEENNKAAPNSLGYSTFSVLPHDKYRVGHWILQVRTNNQSIQDFNFYIVNDPELYGELPWQQGKYLGYIYHDVLGGYGKLTLSDGTVIAGEFGGPSWDDLNIWNGLWKYADGRQFYGNFLHTTDVAVWVQGYFKELDGTTKHIEGYYKKLDSSCRFDKLTLYGTIDEAIKAKN